LEIYVILHDVELLSSFCRDYILKTVPIKVVVLLRIAVNIKKLLGELGNLANREYIPQKFTSELANKRVQVAANLRED